MPFEWFVALRYLREGKAQTALILAAVAIGVSVIVFLSALINGLQASLIEQTLGSQPHVTLSPPELVPRPLFDPGIIAATRIEHPPQPFRSIEQWRDVIPQVERIPGVVAVSPTVTGAAFASRAVAQRPVLVRGVDPERFLAIIDLRRKLIAGRFSVSGTDVVLGAGLADLLGVGVGDRVRIAAPNGRDTLALVRGVVRLGIKDVDERWVISSLRTAQTLFDLPGGASTLEIRVDEVFDAERVATDIASITGLEANSWMKINAQLLVGLQSQESSKYMIEFFVVLSVALGIASVLIVSVVQKSREIGILRAVGTPASRVRRVFLLQGGLLGLCGSVVGCGLGAAFALVFEGLAVNPDGTPRIPVALDLSLFLGASLLATGIGLGAALLPAIRASRLDPARAIRYG